MEDDDLRHWQYERAHFERVRDELWQREPALRNKYVAFRHRQLVGASHDKFELAAEIARKFPGEVVFIGALTRGTRKVRIPSPRVKK